MPIEEVVEVARWAFNNHLGNVMLQSGELRTPQRLEYLERMVKAVREETVRMDRERRGPEAQVKSQGRILGIFQQYHALLLFSSFDLLSLPADSLLSSPQGHE